jgi:hypothetical protein
MSGSFDRGGTNGIYFIRLRSSCHPKAMTINTGLKMPMKRTSESLSKAS